MPRSATLVGTCGSALRAVHDDDGAAGVGQLGAHPSGSGLIVPSTFEACATATILVLVARACLRKASMSQRAVIQQRHQADVARPSPARPAARARGSSDARAGWGQDLVARLEVRA